MLSCRCFSWLLVALAVTLALPSCSVRKVAKSAVEGSADAIEERTSKQGASPVGSVVGKLLEDPQIKQSVRGLIREGVEGVVPQIPGVMGAAAQGALRGTAQAVQGPGRSDLDTVTHALASSASHSLAEILSSQENGSLRPVFEELVRTTAREAALGTTDALTHADLAGSEALREKLVWVGYGLGDGVGLRLSERARGPLLVLAALAVVLGGLLVSALYALWRQGQATARALVLLAERGDRP